MQTVKSMFMKYYTQSSSSRLQLNFRDIRHPKFYEMFNPTKIHMIIYTTVFQHDLLNSVCRLRNLIKSKMTSS